MKKKLLFVVLLLMCLSFVYSQEISTYIFMYPIDDGEDISQSDIASLEKLLFSYIADYPSVRVFNSNTSSVNLDTLPKEAKIFEMRPNLYKSEDNEIVLFLKASQLAKVNNSYEMTNKDFSIADKASSMAGLVLKAKSIVFTLLSQIVESKSEIEQVDYQESPNIKSIVGTWKGDSGLETIRISPNNTALAVLSGGGILKLRISFDNSTIIFYQDQENTANMYKTANINYETAKEIASLARPMEWSFLLTEDSSGLHGIKNSIAVSKENGKLTVDNSYQREAIWTKISK